MLTESKQLLAVIMLAAAVVACGPGPEPIGDYIEPTELDLSSRHACANQDNSVICWGKDPDTLGYLSVPSELSLVNDIAVGEFHSCALDENGVSCWGGSRDGQGSFLPLNAVPSLTNPSQITSGANHLCALDAGGVKCWYVTEQADNDPALLSVPIELIGGVNAAENVQLSAGLWHTCAIKGGEVFCWGVSSGLFEVGQTDVPSDIVNATSIASSTFTTCIVDDNATTDINDDAVKCWGAEGSVFDNGQTDSPVVDSPYGVASGSTESCALSSGGIVCWGDPDKVSTAQASIISSILNPSKIFIGFGSACTIDDSGVTCWDYAVDLDSEYEGVADNAFFPVTKLKK